MRYPKCRFGANPVALSTQMRYPKCRFGANHAGNNKDRFGKFLANDPYLSLYPVALMTKILELASSIQDLVIPKGRWGGER
eukprot:3933914-Alexandrium_andersonii.AAC.1